MYPSSRACSSSSPRPISGSTGKISEDVKPAAGFSATCQGAQVCTLAATRAHGALRRRGLSCRGPTLNREGRHELFHIALAEGAVHLGILIDHQAVKGVVASIAGIFENGHGFPPNLRGFTLNVRSRRLPGKGARGDREREESPGRPPGRLKGEKKTARREEGGGERRQVTMGSRQGAAGSSGQ